ncbi:MAG: hypothetical protein IT380_20395, partial [Myxococcales bacterium]|nr:hypothetical protein [Myxococcales bacterium]
MRLVQPLALAAFFAVSVAACFSAVPETPCTIDADCPSGQRCNGTA